MSQQIKLNQLKLKNFKGIKDFTLKINGKNASVFGENGTGKTTIYDSFLWLFFGKDSSGRSDFGIKTTDENGEVFHGLEHEVEAILLINGKPLNLRKMLEEKWTKKRGESNKEFTGHETSYWIDDVPAKKNEFVLKINSIIDEEIFRLLTNPHHFNNDKSYPWKKRRDILMEICGDLSDEEVIASDGKLSRLTEILDGKSVENYKKILHEQIKKLNDDISKIPIRVDELNNSLDEKTVDYTAIEEELERRTKQLADVEKEQTSIATAANLYRQKQQKLRTLENALEARKKAIDISEGAIRKQLVDEQGKLQDQKYKLEREVGSLTPKITLWECDVREFTEKIVSLREQWGVENASNFPEVEDQFTCPTCGQNLPEDQQEQKVAELRTKFDSAKKASLDKVQAEGKNLASRKQTTENDINVGKERLKTIEADLLIIDERLAEIEKELGKEQVAINYKADDEYCRLELAILGLSDELDKPVEDNSAELIQKKQAIQELINGLNKTLSNKDVAEKTKVRIQELKDEERKLASQITELEGQQFLIEEFIKTKVNLSEDSINNRFQTVRFKLFDVQVNGGLEECCRTLVNTNGSWVEWNDANNAGRINAGIDIINTLADHYGISAPIFIDNRESVNELIESQSQIINLVVSKDKNLKVEV